MYSFKNIFISLCILSQCEKNNIDYYETRFDETYLIMQN